MKNTLPKNWVVDYLYSVCKPIATGVEIYKGERLYFSTGSIKENGYKPEGAYEYGNRPSRANRLALENDIFQARMALTDKAVLVQGNLINNLFSTGFIQLRIYNDTVHPKFVFYFLKSKDFNDQKNELATGTTQVSINDGNVKKIKIPVPPFNEQSRIVAKLNKLFEQLDIINASLDKIPVLLKIFRQQLLTQAVNGKLTEEWRKGKDLKEWNIKTLKEIGSARLGKMLDKAKNKGKLFDYLRNTNIRWFDIDFNDLYQMKVEDKELPKYELLFNDILICEGGEPGRAAIWKYDRKKIIFQKALHRIRLNNEIVPEYFLYHLKVDASSGKLNQHFTGTTIKHLTGKEFAKYKISVPSFIEQQEIVNRVENLLEKANSIEGQYNLLKKKIKNLPQSILHKAFKGELVPQLESDGDARELLEEIEKLRKAVGTKTKNGKPKIKKYETGDVGLSRAAERIEKYAK